MRRHAEDVEAAHPLLAVAVLVGPEALEEARRSAALAEAIERVRDVGDVTELEARIAGVIRERAEDLGVAHAEDDGAVAAGRLAEHRPFACFVSLLNEREDLFEEVVLVAAGGGRVDVLVAADAREAVGRDDDRGRAHAAADEPIHAAREVLAEGIDVEDGGACAGEAGEAEERWIGLFGVVSGRQVDVQIAHGRIAERVVFQDVAVEGVDRDGAALAGAH